MWRRGILLLVLCWSCPSVMAEWTYLGTLDGDTILLDKTTLVQTKRNATIWMLTNYGSPTVQEVLSVSKWVEFDCDKNKYRFLAVYGYEGQMQTGAKLFNTPNKGENWGNVEYGSIFKSIQNIACLRKPLIRQR
jgi:outer membrane protein assembly factor BamB